MRQQAAKLRYRSAGTQTCPLTLRICYGGGVGGGLYHSQTNTTWFAHEPGLVVVAPSTPYDAKGLLKAAIRDDNPVIFMEHRLMCNMQAYVSKDSYVTELGKGRVMREGTDVTIVGISHMVLEALRASQ